MKTETTVTSVSPKEMSETANSPRIQTYSKSQLATLYLPHTACLGTPHPPQLDCPKYGITSRTRPNRLQRKGNLTYSGSSWTILQVFGRTLKNKYGTERNENRVI